MATLLNTNEFLNSGMPVSDDIRTAEVSASIQTVELAYLKPFLTADLYNAMLSNTYENVNLKNSVKFAEQHLVFSYMLFDRMRLTRYTAVIKDDEHSKDPDENDIMNICSMHWEQGLQLIVQALLENNLEPADEITPQPPFAELLFKYYNKKEGHR